MTHGEAVATGPNAIHTAYFWQGRPNFGDLLTAPLLAHFGDAEVAWSAAEDADIVCVGSVLEALPPKWSGVIVGAGKLREASDVALPRATVLAVRGPLTARAMGLRGEYALGDPGLLADELVRGVDKHYKLGIVPHWSDVELEHRPEFQRYDPHIIRPSGDPLEVLREIGRCHKIVASSLHGLIVADAFGIPRRTEMTKIFAREGKSFKFEDHAAAVGLPFEVGVTQEAPRYVVQQRSQELYDALVEAGRLLAA